MDHIADRLGTVTVGSASADVWHAWTDGHGEPEVLAPRERTRLARFRDAAAAARYLRTRTLVRRVLAAHLNLEPAHVPITQTDLGKPVVAGSVHFNVSHSGDLIVLAVSADRAVGIDIERRRPVQGAGALMARWLTAAEQEDVTRRVRAGVSESDAFLYVWSLKEARLKALGVGISAALSPVAEQTTAIPLDGILAQLAASRVGPGYVGAVAFA